MSPIEKLKTELETLKEKAQFRFDKINESDYIKPTKPHERGVDNCISIKYANERNKNHAADLGYYNGQIAAYDKALSLLNDINIEPIYVEGKDLIFKTNTL